ncbi:hypothetical protein T484DRAFT_1910735, partial [Baffinella frigidus]
MHRNEDGGSRSVWSVVNLVAFIVLGSVHAVMVKGSARNGGFDYNPAMLVMLSESLKLTATVALLASEAKNSPDSLTREKMGQALVGRDWMLIAPAVLYTASNNLAFHNLLASDPHTYAVLINTKVVWTALLSALFFKLKITRRMWVSLALLTVGGALVTLGDDARLVLDVATISACLAQGWVSSLAGVTNEWLLKFKGRARIHSINWSNLVLYSMSICLNGLTMLIFGSPPKKKKASRQNVLAEASLRAPLSLPPLALEASPPPLGMVALQGEMPPLAFGAKSSLPSLAMPALALGTVLVSGPPAVLLNLATLEPRSPIGTPLRNETTHSDKTPPGGGDGPRPESTHAFSLLSAASSNVSLEETRTGGRALLSHREGALSTRLISHHTPARPELAQASSPAIPPGEHVAAHPPAILLSRQAGARLAVPAFHGGDAEAFPATLPLASSRATPSDGDKHHLGTGGVTLSPEAGSHLGEDEDV